MFCQCVFEEALAFEAFQLQHRNDPRLTLALQEVQRAKVYDVDSKTAVTPAAGQNIKTVEERLESSMFTGRGDRQVVKGLYFKHQLRLAEAARGVQMQDLGDMHRYWTALHDVARANDSKGSGDTGMHTS